MVIIHKRFIAGILGIAFVLGAWSTSQACTRVLMNSYPNYILSARTLDYFGPVHPTLVITPRGIERYGGKEKTAAHWKTKYGSVVIYADGLFPMDGMNEKGLVGHGLFYTNGSQSQKDNLDKPILESPAWLSYILDNYATVAQAVQAIRTKVRLVAIRLPIEYATDAKHIVLEDKSGDSAIIEIDNGIVHIYHNRNYRIVTNPPSYNKQLANLAQYKNVDHTKIPGGLSSEDRFVRANFVLEHLPKPENAHQARGYILSVENSVAHPIGVPAGAAEIGIGNLYGKYSKTPRENKGPATYWITIADISHGEYHFKSAYAVAQTWLKMKDINFGVGQPVRVIEQLNDYAQKNWEGNLLEHTRGKTTQQYQAGNRR